MNVKSDHQREEMAEEVKVTGTLGGREHAVLEFQIV